MSSLLDRLLGRDKKKEPEKKEAPSKVSEEAARKRREELARKRKESEEAREKFEKQEELRKRTEAVQQARKASKAKKEAKEAMEKLVQKGKTLTAEVKQVYVVKSGDSLSKIAKELLGDASRWPELYELNKDVIGDNPNLIKPGQEFKIPK
jgi:nucleoid-associated protein YgaU